MDRTQEQKDEGENVHTDQQKAEIAAPQPPRRQESSFSQALTNFNVNPFSRRRTATALPEPAPPNAATRSSFIPTPSSIPRSSSFFNNLSTFASKSTSTNVGSEDLEQPTPSRRSRKLSDRLAQTPFFHYQNERLTVTPLKSKAKRESNIQIEQRGLMAPLPAPLPRSSTMGNLGQDHHVQNSPKLPSFMRPTSSSAARRSSLNTPKSRITPMPTISSGRMPASQHHTPSHETKSSGRMPASQHRTPSNDTNSSRHMPPSHRSEPAPVNLRTALFSNPPSPLITGVQAPTNTPTSEYFRSLDDEGYEDDEPAEQGQVSLNVRPVRPVRKSSLIPAPVYLRTNTRQEKKDPKKPNVTLSSSDFGNDGTSGSRALQAQQASSMEEDPMEELRATSSVETVVPESKFKGESADHSTHLDEEQSGDTNDATELTSAGNDNADDEDAASDHDSPTHHDMSDPRLIHTALPTQMWAGRFMSLSDRFRNSALPSNPSPTPINNSKSLAFAERLSSLADHPMHDDDRRTKRVFVHLHSLCTTEEARESLAKFVVAKEEADKARAGGPKGAKVKEKHGFFQALMGKKK